MGAEVYPSISSAGRKRNTSTVLSVTGTVVTRLYRNNASAQLPHSREMSVVFPSVQRRSGMMDHARGPRLQCPTSAFPTFRQSRDECRIKSITCPYTSRHYSLFRVAQYMLLKPWAPAMDIYPLRLCTRTHRKEGLWGAWEMWTLLLRRIKRRYLSREKVNQ
jgi:hypothetical protein